MTQTRLTEFHLPHNREHTRWAFKIVYDRDPSDVELETFTDYLESIRKEVVG